MNGDDLPDTNERPADESRPTVWEISSGDSDCEHPPEELDRLADDGLNGYYECGVCGGSLVIQNEVDFRRQR